MTLLRYNRLFLSHLISLKQTRLTSPTNFSAIFVRCATEIRSRRPIQTESNSSQRKNTVNPVAQIKKLGSKAGKRLTNDQYHFFLTSIILFSQYFVQ